MKTENVWMIPPIMLKSNISTQSVFVLCSPFGAIYFESFFI